VPLPSRAKACRFRNQAAPTRALPPVPGGALQRPHPQNGSPYAARTANRWAPAVPRAVAVAPGRRAERAARGIESWLRRTEPCATWQPLIVDRREFNLQLPGGTSSTRNVRVTGHDGLCAPECNARRSSPATGISVARRSLADRSARSCRRRPRSARSAVERPRPGAARQHESCRRVRREAAPHSASSWSGVGAASMLAGAGNREPFRQVADVAE
jgi:hypothetical protein